MKRLDIINRVLLRLKQTALSDLNDKSVRSIDIQSQYEITLDALLARYEWSFATKDICILPLKEDKESDHASTLGQCPKRFKQDIFERYIYPLPQDFIRKAWANRAAEEYDIMTDGVHTSGPNELKMVYVFKLRNEEKLPGYFIRTLVPILCYDLSDKLSLSTKDSSVFLQESEMFYEEAARNDSFNKRTQKLPQSQFEAAHEAGY